MLARVVKASDVLVGQRERRADDLRQAQAASATAAALAEARAAGVRAGREQALAEGAQAALRATAALEALVDVAQGTHAEQVTATSRAVLAAALDVAEWVLRHELPRDSRSLLTRLGEAAGALLPSPTTRVSVSAADEQAVRGWAQRRGGALEVTVDPALAPGDAALATDAGNVEVSVAAALRIAAETLGVDPSRGVQ